MRIISKWPAQKISFPNFHALEFENKKDSRAVPRWQIVNKTYHLSRRRGRL